MEVKSSKVSINKGREEFYNFLSNPQNYADMMPYEVKNFSAVEKEGKHIFSFTIQGMPEISFAQQSAEPFSKLEYRTLTGTSVVLKFEIFEEPDDKSSFILSIDADVNPFMKMMVERPLKKFVSDFSEKLALN